MLFESLETRRLMSASPSQLAIDRLQIQSDSLTFAANLASNAATLDVDGAALTADGIASDSTLMPLFATLHSDSNAMRAQLAVACLNETSAVDTDQSAIAAEQIKVIQDIGNPSEESADHAQIVADRIQVQQDEITGLTNRLNIRNADYGKIFNDLSAITAALPGDTGASSQLVSDVQKFVTVRTAGLNAFTSDLQKLVTDHTTLHNDLQ
jgi:hypothetical protein